jgi:hypothetical protein
MGFEYLTYLKTTLDIDLIERRLGGVKIKGSHTSRASY